MCSLKLGSLFKLESLWGYFRGDVCLTSAGAVKLASLLSRFNNISHLNLDAEELDALIISITHKSLKELGLSGIILTPVVSAALGRSLPQLSSLKILDGGLK